MQIMSQETVGILLAIWEIKTQIAFLGRYFTTRLLDSGNDRPVLT